MIIKLITKVIYALILAALVVAVFATLIIVFMLLTQP